VETESAYEHLSFAEAAALREPLRSMFPKSTAEAKTWRPTIRRRALNMRVLVAARTRIEFAWAAYIKDVPGVNHDDEVEEVLRHGSKLDERLARVLFPEFRDVPYAR